MNIPLQKLPLLEIKSFTNEPVTLVVDRSSRTCNCRLFIFGGERHCEHLDAVGVHQQKAFTPRARPTFSQALSGLVKSIRMRRTDDAIYWLLFLDGFKAKDLQEKKKMRFRVARRILIASSEDGHSISVMEKVASHFSYLCKPEAPLDLLAAEILRICKLPNWWNPATGGHDYLFNSLVGYRRQVLYQTIVTLDDAWFGIRRAVESSDKAGAIGILCLLGKLGLNSTKQAESLLKVADDFKHLDAIRLVNIHLGARSALSCDNNFLSQAAWMLAGGHSPTKDLIEPVSGEEVCAAIKEANRRWNNPQPIPNYYCDGIHCAGNDRRFAGLLPDMYAVCMAFNRYGNIHPENQWLPEFYALDGLGVEI